MVTTRRAMFLTVLLAWLPLAAVACGGGDVGSTVGDTMPAPEEAAASPADPCALVPLAEWKSATALSGLQLDHDGPKTCDVLDDANARVAGSVKLLDPSSLDGIRERYPSVAVSGVGDDAIWVASSQLYVRRGNDEFSVMVNPIAVENNREVAERLARVALSKR